MILVFCDGGSRGNPGPAAYGFVIQHGEVKVLQSNLEWLLDGKTLYEGKKFLGSATNNVAEWEGLKQALTYLVQQGLTSEPVQVFLDSLLVVNQMNGSWKVKQPHLKPYHAEVTALKNNFHSISFTHIYREFNKNADRLANEAMDAAEL